MQEKLIQCVQQQQPYGNTKPLIAIALRRQSLNGVAEISIIPRDREHCNSLCISKLHRHDVHAQPKLIPAKLLLAVCVLISRPGHFEPVALMTLH